MTDELIKDKVYPLKIGDKEYKLTPVNWGILAQIERKFGSVKNVITDMAEKPYSVSLDLAEIFLPGEDLKSIMNNKDIANINTVIGEIMMDFFKGV